MMTLCTFNSDTLQQNQKKQEHVSAELKMLSSSLRDENPRKKFADVLALWTNACDVENCLTRLLNRDEFSGHDTHADAVKFSAYLRHLDADRIGIVFRA